VGISTAVAVPAMIALDRVGVRALAGEALPGDPLFLGAAGLGLGATAGAWVEVLLLRRALRTVVPEAALPWRRAGRMGALALAAGLPAAGLWAALPAAWPALATAPLVVSAFVGAYLVAAYALGVAEMDAWIGRLR
jgi:hypothetical protein